MANQTLTLNYNVTKRITLKGKNAANTAERPISNITYSTVNGQFISVMATANPNEYDVTNISPTTNGGASINWSAKNELGNNINGTTNITLVAADPAVSIETTYSDPS